MTIPQCISLLLLTTSATGQMVGGNSDTLYQWNGAAASDFFGNAVADAGDVNADGYADIIVGANMADPNGLLSAGSAYVYSGANGALLYRWDGGTANEFFGYSVAGAGDVNNDGYADLAVGNYGADFGGLTNGGSVYVFSGANGTVLYRWDGSHNYGSLGKSVSAAGDVNGDGYADVIAGADATSEGGISLTGSAFVYSGMDGSILHQWHGAASGDRLGNAVSNAGDVNGDGTTDLIVGASQAAPGGLSRAGSAYVFSGADGSQLHQWSGEATSNDFGHSVSTAQDVNSDGYADLIVGAYIADNGGLFNSGSAYVYSGLDGTLLHQWDGNEQGIQFGYRVADAGDINEDGTPDLMISAYNANPNGLPLAGSVFFYSGAEGSPLLQWDGAVSYGRFGSSIANAGDVDADGMDDFVVGANGSGAGSAFVLDFKPFMNADIHSASASAGGVMNLDLNFPIAAGLDEYKILISRSGIGPTNYGVDIPLTQDSLVVETYFGNYPMPVHSGLHGTLDANGDASAGLTVPAGIPSALIGNIYYLAAIANQVGQLPEYSSVAVSLTIVP